VRNLLEVCQVRVEQARAQPHKVAVLRVVDLDNAPRVPPGADDLAVPNVNLFLTSDNGKRQKGLP
jgi:hypothetical protein